MERERAARLIDEKLREYKRLLGIEHAQVEVRFERIDQDREGYEVAADCLVLPEYDRARVRIDLRYVNGAEDLLRSLRHELIHVMLSSFAHYHEVVCLSLVENGNLPAAIAQVRHYAEEQAVARIERMLDRLEPSMCRVRPESAQPGASSPS